MIVRFFAALFFSLWAGLSFAGDALKFVVDPVPLIINSTSDISYELEIADTDIERAAGLMFRVDLPENRALLFDFGQTRGVAMWMKNTPRSLDMLFVDESGLIVGIAPNTTPQSLDVIGAPQPVRFVLEINGGQAAKQNIKIGDRLVHPMIKH